MSGSSCVNLEYRGCATPGGWVTPRKLVLIFGYIVECTNTKILSSRFFAISILNPNYDVINDAVSGFAKVVVE